MQLIKKWPILSWTLSILTQLQLEFIKKNMSENGFLMYINIWVNMFWHVMFPLIKECRIYSHYPVQFYRQWTLEHCLHCKDFIQIRVLAGVVDHTDIHVVCTSLCKQDWVSPISQYCPCQLLGHSHTSGSMHVPPLRQPPVQRAENNRYYTSSNVWDEDQTCINACSILTLTSR